MRDQGSFITRGSALRSIGSPLWKVAKIFLGGSNPRSLASQGSWLDDAGAHKGLAQHVGFPQAVAELTSAPRVRPER